MLLPALLALLLAPSVLGQGPPRTAPQESPTAVSEPRLRHQKRFVDANALLRSILSRNTARGRQSLGKKFHLGRLQSLRRVWCRRGRFRQKVKAPHCRKRFVNNHFCFGQCSSVFIPQFFEPNTGQDRPAFQSCGFCFPRRRRVVRVRLDCPRLSPPFKDRFVSIVESCGCIDIKNLTA